MSIESSRPLHRVPKILEEVTEHGTRYYLCEGNRKFVAETYDANFAVIRTPMKPKSSMRNKSSRSVNKRPNAIKGGV